MIVLVVVVARYARKCAGCSFEALEGVGGLVVDVLVLAGVVARDVAVAVAPGITAEW